MRKWMGLAAALALLLAGNAQAQTPTPVTAATPGTVDPSVVRNDLAGQTGGLYFQGPMSFEGGAQIGTSAAGASLLQFVARGSCVVDPSASLGDGAETIVSCAQTGVAAGDFVVGAIETTSDVTDVYIKRARAESGSVHFSIGSYTAAQNPGNLTLRYLVVR